MHLDSRLTRGHQQRLHISAASGPGLIVSNVSETLEITCRDIASVAWGIYSNSLSFQQRFGIVARYSDDFNGGGDQSLEIGKGEHVFFENYVIRVIYSRFGEGNFVYEADLLMDGSKDYHPTRNLGKTQFFADRVFVDIADPDDVLTWINESYVKWREHLTRICEPHSTLREWVDSHLDMAVKCADYTCNNEVRIIPNNDLKPYVTAGVTLEDLQNRLVCARCKRRRPRIAPF